MMLDSKHNNAQPFSPFFLFSRYQYYVFRNVSRQQAGLPLLVLGVVGSSSSSTVELECLMTVYLYSVIH
jgi:hypothetical protein